MLNTMAENPKIMTISLKNGIRKATSSPENAGPFDSSLFSKRNNKKQILQMKVNRKKNEINFIEIKDLKILSPK